MAWLELDRLDIDAALAPTVAALIADAACDATVDQLEELRARVFDHLEARGIALAPADARRLTTWFVDQRARALAPHRLELERFRIAIRSSTISLYEAEPNGTMLWIYNSQLERRAGSMIGRRLAELMSPAEGAKLDAILADVIATGKGRVFEAHLEIGGVKRVLFLAFEPRRDASGEIVGLVGSSVDITDPKRAEEELALALVYRETMMGILGHDLRNPVGAIQGVVGLLDLDPALSAQARKGLAHIDKAARRMGEMIQTVLDFTRARHGGFPIKRHAMALDELCTSVIDEALAAAPGRQIALATDGDVRGEWDQARLAQVVSNLVGNALVHGAPDTPVELGVSGVASTVSLAVTNRGATLAAAERERLFEPFTRGPDGLRPGKGLGLGLYIARQIVVAHAGTIAVDSSDGTTVFTVQLPRAAQ